jgi:hypothetical protein
VGRLNVKSVNTCFLVFFFVLAIIRSLEICKDEFYVAFYSVIRVVNFIIMRMIQLRDKPSFQPNIIAFHKFT